jgi:hypothetical protein
VNTTCICVLVFGVYFVFCVCVRVMKCESFSDYIIFFVANLVESFKLVIVRGCANTIKNLHRDSHGGCN